MSKKSVGGAWKRTSKNGNRYLYIKLDSGEVYLAFDNDYKEEDKHPDFKLYPKEDESEARPVSNDDEW
jgi:uncharacterized protein (DUF736 family)